MDKFRDKAVKVVEYLAAKEPDFGPLLYNIYRKIWKKYSFTAALLEASALFSCS